MTQIILSKNSCNPLHIQVTNWWSQIKTAGAAIYANRHYLGKVEHFQMGSEEVAKELTELLVLLKLKGSGP